MSVIGPWVAVTIILAAIYLTINTVDKRRHQRIMQGIAREHEARMHEIDCDHLERMREIKCQESPNSSNS